MRGRTGAARASPTRSKSGPAGCGRRRRRRGGRLVGSVQRRTLVARPHVWAFTRVTAGRREHRPLSRRAPGRVDGPMGRPFQWLMTPRQHNGGTTTRKSAVAPAPAGADRARDPSPSDREGRDEQRHGRAPASRMRASAGMTSARSSPDSSSRRSEAPFTSRVPQHPCEEEARGRHRPACDRDRSREGCELDQPGAADELADVRHVLRQVPQSSWCTVDQLVGSASGLPSQRRGRVTPRARRPAPGRARAFQIVERDAVRARARREGERRAASAVRGRTRQRRDEEERVRRLQRERHPGERPGEDRLPVRRGARARGP